MMRKFVFAIFLLTTPAVARQGNGGEGQPLYGNLGPHNRRITTSSDTAQAYFNEGLQFMFAFGPSSALLSFREAQKHDPNCAMCFWGEAWALSPYLNGGMRPAAEKEAYAAIHKAKDLAGHGGHANDAERAIIDAFMSRYTDEPTAETRRPLDSLYSREMHRVAASYPRDNDIQALAGESLMLLRPRRGSVDLEDPSVKTILSILEGVLERDIKHPEACHLYIHLVEASPEPGRAEACSDYLGDAIPGASHIRHMPSHIYMNIGRYSDAVKSNQNAWHVDQQAAYGGPPGIYPSHNLHMLLFGATLDGQSAVAIQAAKDLAKISSNWAFYHPVSLANFGRWEEVLEFNRSYDDPFQEGMLRYAKGMARLRTEAVGLAKAELQALRTIIEQLPDSARFRFHSQSVLLSIPAGILEGEIAAAEGRYDDAVRILEATVETEDGLTYDEPEPWHHPARHVLGAILLEMDRAGDAVRVYREALEDHPRNGWSLFGLEQALRAQGKDSEADRVHERYERDWARRDVWLRSSRF